MQDQTILRLKESLKEALESGRRSEMMGLAVGVIGLCLGAFTAILAVAH